MERDTLSLRQIMVLVITALLAPATDLLPVLTAQRAGSGGWLSLLGAFPLLLAALWAALAFCGSGGICQAMGGVFGRIMAGIYMVWALVVLTVSLRLCAARLEGIYGKGPAFACAAALLLAAVWMGWGKASAFARAGEIFYLALTVALIGVLFLAAFKVEGSGYHMTWTEAAAIPGSSLMAAGLLLNVYPAVSLGKLVKPGAGDVRRMIGWVAAFCGAVTLLLAAITGCIGPNLMSQLPSPFLIMVQGLGIEGAFQRTEALFAALWALSDLTLATLLLHAWRALGGILHPGKWTRWSIFPAAVAALLGGLLLFPEAEDVRVFSALVLPAVGLGLGFFCPLFVRIFTRRRKGKF